jgi:hypothetical protein
MIPPERVADVVLGVERDWWNQREQQREREREIEGIEL